MGDAGIVADVGPAAAEELENLGKWQNLLPGDALFIRSEKINDIRKTSGQFLKVRPVLPGAAAAGVNHNALRLGLPEIGQRRGAKLEGSQQVRGSVAIRRKRIGANNIPDSGSPKVFGQHGIFHPHDGAIEIQSGNRLMEKPRPRRGFDGVNSLYGDELPRQFQC